MGKDLSNKDKINFRVAAPTPSSSNRGNNSSSDELLLSSRRESKFKASGIRDILRERYDYAMNHWQKEKILLRYNYKLLMFAVFFQYVHSVMTNIAYYLHVQREPLYDLGFALLPALTPQMQVVSELVFFAFIFSTISFAFSPFFQIRKNMYTTLIVSRFFGVCVLAQTLRCISFLATSLPGPNYHCRPDSTQYHPPKNWRDIFFRQDAFFGCGDLVFSSHTIFVLLCALTYTKYGGSVYRKFGVWCLVFVFGLLVVAARKHYSLDIVVAWYTVPLLWIAYDRYCPDRIPQEILDDDEEKDDIVKRGHNLV